MADNVSSGIEPVFSHYYNRTIQTFTGPREEKVEDYAYAQGVAGRTADSLSVGEHLNVLSLASHYVDSAVSKTCNVGDEVTFDEFEEVYQDAWLNGCKGVTTFRKAGKRYGILTAPVEIEETPDGEITSSHQEGGEKIEACFIDPNTGIRSCE